jgi:hypothetical protein
MGVDKNKSNRINAKLTVGTSTEVLSDDKTSQTVYEVYDEKQIRLITQSTGSSVVDIEGLLAGMDPDTDSNWEQIDQHSGATSAAYDIDTYSFIRFNLTTADTGGTLYVASFFSAAAAAAGNSFSTIQGDSGTNPVADSSADTLTVSGVTGETTTTGDSSTDTLTVGLASQLLLDDGTTGAPTYSFSNETTSGLAYSAGELYLSRNAKIFSVTATACIAYKRLSIRNNGSAANPSIYYGGSGADYTGWYAATYNSAAERMNVGVADNTDVAYLTADGPMFRMTTTAITDGNMVNNTLAFFENGSGNLEFKYKNSGGTVTTGTVTLS